MYKHLWLLVLIISCEPIHQGRHVQQKYLVPKSIDDISHAIDDFLPEPPLIPDTEDDLETTIDERFYNKVSISMTKEMPLVDLISKLANSAGINIVIAPDVDGKMMCNARQRKFINLLQDICDSAGLKYTIDGDSAKIEYDSPVLRNYNLQFLNIQRDLQSSVSTSTDIFTDKISLNESSSSGSDKNNGSRSLIAGNLKNDFWGEVEKNLTQIVGDDGNITMHKQGGLISVYATQKKQNAVKKYLKLLKQSVESQVLIEAKILEVTLNDEFKHGINWNIIGPRGSVQYNNGGQEGLFSFGIDRTNLKVMEGVIEKFGAVKTLSNPRITVLNNQSAVMKVAENKVVYIPSLQKQYSNTQSGNNFDYMTTTLHTIPIGLILSVVPSIDRKTNSIILNLRPTITRTTSNVEVPFNYINSAGTVTTKTEKIPVVDVREFDSVLRLQSGQVAVMGGLMQETSTNNRSGLPRASELDFAFGSREKGTKVTELVIFLKATILNKRAYHAVDKELYQKFSNDPRRLFKKEK